MRLVSIVSPVHNEGTGIADFLQAVRDALEGEEDYEVILVDDGSTDDSWEWITRLSNESSCIKGVRLSRNFGKEAAVIAGLEASRGDATILLDSDLQHPPELIRDMLELWQLGADVVEARKTSRTDQSLPSRIQSRLFNSVFTRLTGVDLDEATDFRLLSRPALDALLSFPERTSFFRGLSSWIGFRREVVLFDVQPRSSGTSKWSSGALARMAINAITAFTARPLHIVTAFALIFAVIAGLLGVQTFYQWASGEAVAGFTTVILVLLVQGSMILFGLGVVGEYVARIHEEVKQRPRYIVSERT